MNKMKIKLGLDFDNTLIMYDQLFYKLALEKEFIDNNFPVSKLEIRELLRRQGRDEEFTFLQAEVYGPRIFEADISQEMIKTLLALKNQEIEMLIISHKTKKPYKGPPYELRNYALEWLQKNKFFSLDGLAWQKNQVFFESTKEDKAKRIIQLGCTHYVDDLPEILDLLPENISRIHYSPNNVSTWKKGPILKSWEQLKEVININ